MTGIRIYDTSASAARMSFRVEGLGQQPIDRETVPVVAPSSNSFPIAPTTGTYVTRRPTPSGMAETMSNSAKLGGRYGRGGAGAGAGA